jgi:hypothetical protein
MKWRNSLEVDAGSLAWKTIAPKTATEKAKAPRDELGSSRKSCSFSRQSCDPLASTAHLWWRTRRW